MRILDHFGEVGPHPGRIASADAQTAQAGSRPLREIIPVLRRKLIGLQNYFGLPDKSCSLSRLHNHVLRSLYKWLNRRSQHRSYNWSSLKDMSRYFQIAPLRVSKRQTLVDWYLGLVNYTSECITEEPDAVVPHVRICVRAVR